MRAQAATSTGREEGSPAMADGAREWQQGEGGGTGACAWRRHAQLGMGLASSGKLAQATTRGAGGRERICRGHRRAGRIEQGILGVAIAVCCAGLRASAANPACAGGRRLDNWSAIRAQWTRATIRTEHARHRRSHSLDDRCARARQPQRAAVFGATTVFTAVAVAAQAVGAAHGVGG